MHFKAYLRLYLIFSISYNFNTFNSLNSLISSKNKKPSDLSEGLIYKMASTEGFEPSTARLEGVCSIQLSYVDIYINCYKIIPYRIRHCKYYFKLKTLFCNAFSFLKIIT